MQNYKDLKVWQKGHQFTLKVYEITKAFPKEETYGLVSQLRRAASSVPANIAEG
jgi:four helix bundle protein